MKNIRVIVALVAALFSVSAFGQNPPVENRKPNDPPGLVERTDDRTPRGWRAYEYDVDEKHRVSFILPADDLAEAEAPFTLPLEGELLDVKRQGFVVNVLPNSEGKSNTGLPIGVFQIAIDREPSFPLSTMDESRRLKLPAAHADLIAAENRKSYKAVGLSEPTFASKEPSIVREKNFTGAEQQFSLGNDRLRIRVLVIGNTLVWAITLTFPWAKSDESEIFFSHFTVSER